MNRAPLILAIVLLLLPALYVGSYLALVRPEFDLFYRDRPLFSRPNGYRVAPEYCAVVFWPLETCDRRMRPAAWADPWEVEFENAVRDIRTEGQNFSP